LGTADRSVGPTEDRRIKVPASHDQAPQNKSVTQKLTRRYGRLPHWQLGGSVYFITFRSARGTLPDHALNRLSEHILYDHGKRYDLSFAVLMPDHVHLVIKPTEKSPGRWYDLAEILKSLKGTSARSINNTLGTTGTVWQKESFDRIIRDETEYEATLEYMYWNPFKSGLVKDPDDYAFFVRPPLA
jgi:REP element-mobilizing transposase RayT